MVRKIGKLAAPIVGLFLTLQSAMAVELDWLERYALANDRTAILKELIPETEDYFRFHTLHYQTTGQLDLAEAMLNRWASVEAFKDSVYVKVFRDRQMLLTFSSNPDRTFEYLRTRLNLELNHAPPVTQQQRTYPDVVPGDLFKYETLVKQAIQTNSPLSQAALRFVGNQVLASPDKTYEGATAWWVLERLTDFSYENLAKLVTTELQGRVPNTRAFGDQQAHRHLTLEELKRLRNDVPEVANSEALIHEIVMRMAPITNIDLRKDLARKREHLTQVYLFVSELPDAFNTLKAHTLYRLLELNVSLDIYDQSLFVSYLKLPRASGLVQPLLQNRPGLLQAQLGADYSELMRSPPIVNEEPLVRNYLEHFFRDAKDTSAFRGLLQDDYLNQVFAEAKLLNGATDADRYFAMLSPASQRAIKDRVELQLTALNREFSATDAPQALSLDIKGMSHLIVRTYKINTNAYYRSRTDVINSDIDLDGLIASRETAYEYNHPSQVRHRENITLPEIEGRGVWIVDLLGGGLRCRAVVRRGDVRAVLNIHDSGHVFTILDETNQRIADAKIRIGAREYSTDKEGRTLVPFVESGHSETAIISDGQLATPVPFEHQAEIYTLNAAMQLQRESLVSGHTTELIVRPQLRLGQVDVALKRIDTGTVIVSAKDSNGIETKRRFEKLKFSDHLDTTVQFRVPENCREITATLEAELVRLTNGQRQILIASQSWPVSTFADTPNVNDVFLTRSDKRWIIEVRGRNGEPISGASVQLTFATSVSSHVQTVATQSNEKGQVYFEDDAVLGSVSALLSNGQTRSWVLHQDYASFPGKLFAISSAPIRLSVITTKKSIKDSQRFRLRELRSSRPAVELSQKVKFENGFIVIEGLKAGDYELVDLETEAKCTISVADGQVVDGYTIDNPWQTPVERANATTISSASVANGKLSVSVAGATEFTRVHVLASRYLPTQGLWRSLNLPHDTRESRSRMIPPNLFLSGLKLGDEYQYVLRRQSAKKFPGVILPQPSLLLNPWVIDTAENTRQSEAAGDMPMAAPMPEAAKLEAAQDRDELHRMADQNYSGFDFLREPAIVLPNIEVTDGKVELDAELFNDYAIITVIATDPQQIIELQIFNTLQELQRRELRLPRSYKSELNLAQRRSLRVVDAKHPLAMADMGLAQLQIYRTIGELMPVLGNLNGDARWSEFNVLGIWHTLNDQQKLDAYSRLASHELHLFLFVKDRAFFDKHIKTYLANKKEKQFIDDFLLQNELRGYLTIWRYQQLNAAEKALLAIAISETRATIVRELNELTRLIPINAAEDRRKIESAMSGKLMELGDLAAATDAAARYSDGVEMGGMGGGIATFDAQNGAFFDKESSLSEYAEEKSWAGSRGVQLHYKRRDAADAKDFYFGVNGPALYAGATLTFQALELTKQWAESQWDHVRGIDSTRGLVTANRFWKDLASAGKLDGFVSDNVLEATDTRHASLVALALLNLPMQSEFQLPAESNATLAPDNPIIVAARQTIELKESNPSKKIMVGQSVAAVNASATEGPEDEQTEDHANDQTITPEYLVNTPYEAKITLTNLSNKAENFDVLWQIPTGAIGLPNATSGKTTAATDSMNMNIDAFSTATVAYTFYFPAAGEFRQYPPCVSRKDQALAKAEPTAYKVVEQATQVDEASWEYIAAHGSADQIKAYLAKANLRKVVWSRVYHRLKDQAIYKVVLQALSDNFLAEPAVLGYAVYHKDRQALQVLLENRGDIVSTLGPNFQSDLLSVEPISRKMVEHIEFAPLVVPRIHPLREKLELTNAKLGVQYWNVLETIAYSRQIDPATNLAIVYYQLINNRIDEAISRFRRIDAKSTNLQIQYDYLDAYLALHQMDVERATQIAAKYSDMAIPRWKARFEEIATQVRDYQSLQTPSQLVKGSNSGTKPDQGDLALIDRERRQQQSALSQPTINVKLEGDQLKIDHANTKNAAIRLYAVDLEMLFSKMPFVREGLDRMAIAQATSKEQIDFESATGSQALRLPEKYRNQTLLIEVESGAARDTVLSYGGQLSSYVAESFGQLQVMHSGSRQPVVGAYVKVYAKHQDGSVRFFKDGYTDLRGRFDYSSISNDDLSTATRFAILVLDKEDGATLHEVDPPR
jgi:hypothetical protein